MNRLFLLALLVTSLSGCRFGNHSDSPTQTNAGSITHSELFSTTVRSFETFAYYSDNTYTHNSSANIAQVPNDVLTVFTSTVYWDTYQDSDTTQFFWDNAKKAAPFLTFADAAGQINVSNPATTAVKLYQNPNCLTQTQFTQTGSFDRTNPSTSMLPGETASSVVSGRLNLDLTHLQIFQGDCAADLQTLAQCNTNGTGCDADQLSRAKLFDLFVGGTSVLNIQDAPSIIGLAYIVHFN